MYCPAKALKLSPSSLNRGFSHTARSRTICSPFLMFWCRRGSWGPQKSTKQYGQLYTFAEHYEEYEQTTTRASERGQDAPHLAFVFKERLAAVGVGSATFDLVLPRERKLRGPLISCCPPAPRDQHIQNEKPAAVRRSARELPGAGGRCCRGVARELCPLRGQQRRLPWWRVALIGRGGRRTWPGETDAAYFLPCAAGTF